MTTPRDDDPAGADEPRPFLDAAAIPIALGVTALVALVFQLAFTPARSGTFTPFLALGGLYAAIGGLAVFRLQQAGQLHLIKPRSGDLTFGALVGFLLFGLVFAFHALVTSPGTPRAGWIIHIYMLLGDPFAENRHLVAGGAALVGLLEELVWRGFVTPLLEPKLGVLRGNIASTLLFGAAHLPTMWSLADSEAGLNPLLVLAALGCGAAWSYFRWRMERLPPVLLSHALFTWAVIEFPLWQ
jgi:membrane protease YdiL (CAAX protease family)